MFYRNWLWMSWDQSEWKVPTFWHSSLFNLLRFVSSVKESGEIGKIIPWINWNKIEALGIAEYAAKSEKSANLLSQKEVNTKMRIMYSQNLVLNIQIMWRCKILKTLKEGMMMYIKIELFARLMVNGATSVKTHLPVAYYSILDPKTQMLPSCKGR